MKVEITVNEIFVNLNSFLAFKVSTLCQSDCNWPHFTGVYWHIRVGQTPQGQAIKVVRFAGGKEALLECRGA